MANRDLARFGGIVRRRREDLGLQQEDMRARGGPSSTTMSGIERGAIEPAPSTLRKLDAGLRWKPGSAAKTLGGGDPSPIPDDADSTLRPWEPDGDPRDDIPDLIDFASKVAKVPGMYKATVKPDEVVTILHPAIRMLGSCRTWPRS